MGDGPGTYSLEPLPARNPKVAARFINGETLILTPHDSVLHTLNPVASRIWELLPERRTLSEMAEVLACEYDVDAAQAAADVAELMTALRELKIVI